MDSKWKLTRLFLRVAGEDESSGWKDYEPDETVCEKRRCKRKSAEGLRERIDSLGRIDFPGRTPVRIVSWKESSGACGAKSGTLPRFSLAGLSPE